jgi:glycosyltransferase involved in cell wall biosynthesis
LTENQADKAPSITVLMCVFNGERFIREAIDSVLAQTFQDFELLIINDGSTDSTMDVIASYHDPRIRVSAFEINQGTGFALNKGLSEARGGYVAILDSDDVAVPERLAFQYEFLEKHPGVALHGGAQDQMDEQGKHIGFFYLPTESVAIRWFLLFRNCITHSTAMFRRNVVLGLGGYDPSLTGALDYSMIGPLAIRRPIVQTKEPLVRYRIVETGLTHQAVHSRKIQTDSAHTIKKNIQLLTGATLSTDVAEYLYGGGRELTESDFSILVATLEKCFSRFVERDSLSGEERKKLFAAFLVDTRRIVRHSDAHRLRLLRLAVKLGLRFSISSLFSQAFISFSVMTITPNPARKFLGRVVRRALA